MVVEPIGSVTGRIGASPVPIMAGATRSRSPFINPFSPDGTPSNPLSKCEYRGCPKFIIPVIVRILHVGDMVLNPPGNLSHFNIIAVGWLNPHNLLREFTDGCIRIHEIERVELA